MKRWSVTSLGLLLLFGLTNGAEGTVIEYNFSGKFTSWEIMDWNSGEYLHPTELPGIGFSVGDHFKGTLLYDDYNGPRMDIKFKQYYLAFPVDPTWIEGSSYTVAALQPGEFYQNGLLLEYMFMHFDLISGEPLYLDGIENILNLDDFYATAVLFGFYYGYLDGILVEGPTGLTGEIDKLKSDPKLGSHSPSFASLLASPLEVSGHFVGTLGALNSSPVPVPEPSTVLLLGSGLAGLVAFGRRRMRK